MDYFWGCQHFGHRFLREACNRPFSSVNQQDKTLLRNFAETVKDSDTVFLLGDFAYRNARPVSSYLNELKKHTHAQLVYIKGNHDRWLDDMVPEEKQHYFLMVIDDRQSGRCVIERNGWRIGLSHVPTEPDLFQVPVHASICSHIHNNRGGEDYERFMSINAKGGNLLNCGVDINGFKPVALRQMIANNEQFYGFKYSIPEAMLQAFE